MSMNTTITGNEKLGNDILKKLKHISLCYENIIKNFSVFDKSDEITKIDFDIIDYYSNYYDDYYNIDNKLLYLIGVGGYGIIFRFRNYSVKFNVIKDKKEYSSNHEFEIPHFLNNMIKFHKNFKYYENVDKLFLIPITSIENYNEHFVSNIYGLTTIIIIFIYSDIKKYNFYHFLNNCVLKYKNNILLENILQNFNNKNAIKSFLMNKKLSFLYNDIIKNSNNINDLKNCINQYRIESIFNDLFLKKDDDEYVINNFKKFTYILNKLNLNTYILSNFKPLIKFVNKCTLIGKDYNILITDLALADSYNFRMDKKKKFCIKGNKPILSEDIEFYKELFLHVIIFLLKINELTETNFIHNDLKMDNILVFQNTKHFKINYKKYTINFNYQYLFKINDFDFSILNCKKAPKNKKIKSYFSSDDPTKTKFTPFFDLHFFTHHVKNYLIDIVGNKIFNEKILEIKFFKYIFETILSCENDKNFNCNEHNRYRTNYTIKTIQKLTEKMEKILESEFYKDKIKY